MAEITTEMLSSYLDDSLSEAETSDVEQALRESDALRLQLRKLMQERDRGDHSIGAIWRSNRLSCPGREQLGSFLLGVVDSDLADYIQFHLHTVGCSFCLANLADLETLQQENEESTTQRRRRLFETSAGYLKAGQDG